MKKLILYVLLICSFAAQGQFSKPSGAVSIPTYSFYRTPADSSITIYQGSVNLYNPLKMAWDSTKSTGYTSRQRLSTELFKKISKTAGGSSKFQMADGSVRDSVYQPKLTGGTANVVPKWSGASALTNSILYSYASYVSIATPTQYNSAVLNVNGSLTVIDHLYLHGAGSRIYLNGNAGTAGQILTSAGPSNVPTWENNTAKSAADSTANKGFKTRYQDRIADTTNNATYYPMFANASSGISYRAFVTSSKLTFNPSTGVMVSTNFQLSDRRLKKDIEPLTLYDYFKIRSIPFVKYIMKDDPKNKVHFGVIAQDVEAVYPEMVNTDDKGIKSVNYIELLLAKIADLENRVQVLEKTTKKKWRAEKCTIVTP